MCVLGISRESIKIVSKPPPPSSPLFDSPKKGYPSSSNKFLPVSFCPKSKTTCENALLELVENHTHAPFVIRLSDDNVLSLIMIV